MDIHLDFVPGMFVWVMNDNRPIQLKVDSVSITVALDYSKKNVTTCAKYHLTNGAFGSEFTEKSLCHTKDELKEKVFE